MPRRLDRGRDDGALDRALLTPRAGRPARHQDPRPRRARHRRHARHAARRISEAGLGRPGQGRGRFHRQLPESELAAIVRGREAFALYGWKPYMHNPRLKRWLHRIDRPTLLLWGAEDRIVTPAYGEGWGKKSRTPGSRSSRRPATFPHWEQPEAFVERAVGLRPTDASGLAARPQGEQHARLVLLRDGLSSGLGGRA